MITKAIILGATFSLCSFAAYAKDLKEENMECAKSARKFLTQVTQQSGRSIEFWDGAQIGDGAASFEVSLYQIKFGNLASSIYKVEFNAEDCSTPFSVDRIN